MNRRSERGSVMVIVMVILTALLGAGSVAIYVQLADTKTTGLIRSARASLYCAEAGLAQATREVALHYSDWPVVLARDPDDTLDWYPIEIDLDEDGEIDVVVRVVDNDDETPPTPNNPARDNDLKLFLVSACGMYDDTPREIVVLILFDPTVHDYINQAGQSSLNDGNR